MTQNITNKNRLHHIYRKSDKSGPGCETPAKGNFACRWREPSTRDFSLNKLDVTHMIPGENVEVLSQFFVCFILTRKIHSNASSIATVSPAGWTFIKRFDFILSSETARQVSIHVQGISDYPTSSL